MKKIIFLDIDGVLQPGYKQDRFEHDLKADKEALAAQDPRYESVGRYDLGAVRYDWNKQAVERLRCLCEQTQAQIVISSAWRETKSLEQLQLLFRLHGLDSYVIDKTVDDERPYTKTEYTRRDAQIKLYLDQHKDIDAFVVIDDSYVSELEGTFPREFVRCYHIFDTVRYRLALHILQLPHRDLARSEAVLLFNRLRDNDPTLTKADFRAEEIDMARRHHKWSMEIFMEKFREALRKNTHLESLKMTELFYDEYPGAHPSKLPEELIEAVMENTSLKHLDISNENLKEVYAIFGMLEALQKRKPPLETLKTGLKNE
ncbi:MAG: HAD domain-containing protein [Myxococcota bacterium]